jgi:hypothetical protein
MKIHKSQISAIIVADSIGSSGIRLTTFQVRVPKFLLQEIARHRVLSLSFNSSRAIPAKTMRERVNSDPCEPLFWGTNRPGMSAGLELAGWRLRLAKFIWRSHTKITLLAHYLLEKIGLHKQHVNRKLEADLWVDGVMSATEWDNLFDLRIHPDAQPEFRELAAILRDLLRFSNPNILALSAWHLPYISDDERDKFEIEILRDLSTSRCARVSYGLPDFDYQKDIDRARKLKTSNPPHYSPFEHVAQSMYLANYRSGNYRGWCQYRKSIEDVEI